MYCMDTLIIELTAGLVDNFATPNSRTKVETEVINNSGWLTVEDLSGVPRSVHRFTVHNAADVGCPPLDAEQSSYIIAMGCSLISSRVLFSPLQPQRFTPNLRLGELPSKVEVAETPTGKNILITETIRVTGSISILISTKVILDASKLSDVIERLLKLRPFDLANRSLAELNVLDALKRYRDALHAAEPLACYKALFSALEKSVNRSGEEKEGAAFDSAASAATGLSATVIKEIREFNNRVKHAIRKEKKEKDFETLRRGESNLARIAINLKVATDNALLAQI
ncbi:MAG: hypothetical protein AB1796_06175 [Bacillota bacterium]